MKEMFKALAEYGVEMEIHRNKFVPDGCVSIVFSKGKYHRSYILDYESVRIPKGVFSFYENYLVDLIKRFADECDELNELEVTYEA